MNLCQQSLKKKKPLRHNWHNLRQNGYLPNGWQRANQIYAILGKNVTRNIKKRKPKYDYRNHRSEHLRWHLLIDPPCCQVTRQAENKVKILWWELKNLTDICIATNTRVFGFVCFCFFERPVGRSQPPQHNLLVMTQTCGFCGQRKQRMSFWVS